MNDVKNSAVSVDSNNKKEKGASLVEYALLVALIAVVAIVAVRTLGQSVSAKFSALASEIAGTH